MNARWIATAFSLGFLLACRSSPHYTGHYWCFIANDAYGQDADGQNSSIHTSGGPFRVCFCFCDDIHADTLLFTGDNPPDPSNAWLERMDLIHEAATNACHERSAELGLIADNCAEVMPDLPTLWDDELVCYGKPWVEGSYCTQPDSENADDESGGSESDSSGETSDPELLDRI